MIWLLIMIPCSMLFTGIGVYAFRSKKPVHFWSGSTVSESQLKDVKAYNRANGWMWLAYSCLFWLSVILSFFSETAAGIFLLIAAVPGSLGLAFAFNKIFAHYKV